MRFLRSINSVIVTGAIVVACAGLGVGVAWAMHVSANRDPIQYANFEKIKTGMSPQQVEELLGCPPGTYSKRRPTYSVCICCDFVSSPKHWHGSRGTIIVIFRDTGVFDKSAHLVAAKN